MEVAVFRKIQGDTSYFITVSNRLLPDTEEITLTIVNPLTWRSRIRYEHIVKKKGRAKIHGSLKITLNKELVEDLELKKGEIVWVRILPFIERPPDPPAIPYIAKPVKVHTDKSSLFFTIAKSQIDYLRMTGVVSGNNLYIEAIVPSGQRIEYVKRPIVIKRDRLYKVILPMRIFEGLVHAHDVIHVKITLTEKSEEYFYP